MKKFFLVLGFVFFVSDVLSDIDFLAILAHITCPRAQLLDGSITLKFF